MPCYLGLHEMVMKVAEHAKTAHGMSEISPGRRKSPRRNRNRLGIMTEILQTAKVGASKSIILSRANLNSEQLGNYLDLLLEAGLLETVNKGGRNLYKTNAKGLSVIQTHKKLTALLEITPRT